jgi:hypothetical protein
VTVKIQPLPFRPQPTPATPPTNEAVRAPVDAFLRSAAVPGVKISTFNDDPFATPSHVETMKGSHFTHDSAGHVTGLAGDRAIVAEDPTIYRQDPQTGKWTAFATNPWSLPKADAMGNFVFDSEPRFPVLNRQLGADGKPVLNADGMQVWNPVDEHLGQTTAFQAVNDVGDAGEKWAGRKIEWGDKGQMAINTHAFYGFNAFFSPASRDLNCGVIAYRLPGSNDIHTFEMSSSWEVVAHESGHAVHHELKPNVGPVDLGFRQWGESFADQTAMWTSLQDPARRKGILDETGGDMTQPSDLSRLGELYSGLTGQGDALRDMINDKTVANTSNEFHDRAEVLNGAMYSVFTGVYADLRKGGLSNDAALKQAGEIMGKMNVRACDHTPENFMTFEDVAKGYLSADKDLNGGRYHDLLVNEFVKRGVFTDKSDAAWQQHQANLPSLKLATGVSLEKAAADLVKNNQSKLGGGPELGYKVQSVETTTDGQKLVRLTLTDKRPGQKTQDLANNALLVFRKDGSLVDYQPALPADLTQFQAVALLDQARQAGLDQKGVIGFVPNPPPPGTQDNPYPPAPGGYTVQVVKQFPTKSDPHLMVYDLAHPNGVRQEYGFNQEMPDTTKMPPGLAKKLPKGAQIVQL